MNMDQLTKLDKVLRQLALLDQQEDEMDLDQDIQDGDLNERHKYVLSPLIVESVPYKMFKEVVEECGGWTCYKNKDEKRKGQKDKSRAKGNIRLDETVFSMDAMTDSRWYNNIAGKDQDNIKSLFMQIVPHKLAHIRNIYGNYNLMRNYKSAMIQWSLWNLAVSKGNLKVASANMKGSENCSFCPESGEKIANFLRYYVDYVVTKTKKDKDEDRSIAITKYNAYRGATSILCHIAAIYGIDEFAKTVTGASAVKILSEELINERNKVMGGVQDYQATSRAMTKTISSAEKNNVYTVLWSGSHVKDIKVRSVAEQMWMRDLLLVSMLDVVGRRGEDLRAIRFAMLLLHKLERVKPVETYGVGASIRTVKERVNSMETMLTWTRTADRLRCPLSILSLYLVWLNDVDRRLSLINEIKKDMIRMKEFMQDKGDEGQSKGKDKWISNWWHYHLVFTKDATEPISASTHIKGYGRIFEEAEVRGKTAKTQTARSTTAISLIEGGLGIEDIETFQGWRHTTTTDIYIRSAFKTGPLLMSCGWSSVDTYDAWWDLSFSLKEKGDTLDKELLNKVFVGLDELADLVDECWTSYQLDYSAVKMVELLKYMRVIYFETIAFLITNHKEIANIGPATRHLSNDFLIKRWADEESKRIKEREQLYYAKRNDPQLAQTLNKVIKEREDEEEVLKKQMNEINKVMFDKEGEGKDGDKTNTFDRTMLIFKDESMSSIYEHWTCYRGCLKNKRIKWLRSFDKNEAKAHSVRYSKFKIWLYYVDSLTDEKGEEKEIISKMSAIAKALKVKEHVFVKEIFYNFAKNGPNAKTTISWSLFVKMMNAAALPLPN